MDGKRINKQIKFCRDCKWYRRMWAFVQVCERPELVEIDLVTGKVYQACPDAMREDENCCGPSGKYWEAKK